MEKTSNVHWLAVIASTLLLLASFPAHAGNFAEEINNQPSAAGQKTIYELNVGSFTTEGTFVAASRELSRLKRLGVDIVWLMPIYPRGGGINSPYAAKNFQQTNPSYGTIADLKALVDEAHALHMEVWLDWVPNHTATDADWVSSHPEYYVSQNGQMVHPNNYGDVFQLNYNKAQLVKAMNDCLKFWIDQADIDGYRCDYVSSNAIPASYWQQTIAMLKAYKPGKTITMMGEADFTEQTRLQNVGFDYDYAWGFQSRLASFGPNGKFANPLRTYATSFFDASSAMPVSRMLYLTNHDQNWNEATKTLTQKYGDNRYLLEVLTHTLWGMPLLYNGEEIGGNQALNYFEDTKVNWAAVDSKMLNTLCVLNALKHSQEALRDGKALEDNGPLTILNTNVQSSVLAYKREKGNSEVIVVLNPSNSMQNVTISGVTGSYSVWLNSDSIAMGVGRYTLNVAGTLSLKLAPKGYQVLVKGNYPEENTLGIESLLSNHNSLPDGAVYSLMGIKMGYDLSSLPSGVYIQNGHKFLIR